MSYMPGKLFFDGKRGILEENAMADITIFSTHELNWTVEKEKILHKRFS